MSVDLTVKVGGEAGQGIQTIGWLLAKACHHAGLHVFLTNDFESRIRGGHNFCQLRISDRPVRSVLRRINLLVALDHQSIDVHGGELLPGGKILASDRLGEESEGPVVILPLDDLARKAGSPITANTVAAGAVLCVIGVPFEIFENVLQQRFADQSPQSMKQNLAAARLGYQAVQGLEAGVVFEWSRRAAPGVLIEGARALSLGALAGDCRFAAFYPMSPATSIMHHLASYQKDFPLVVEQAEDEIAAVNMIVGAAYAGVRSLTATSGGGFCLMTEGLGLAGITETPIVIINAQRPGPATGLATRTAQGDLQFVIRAGQDDFPRFVFAPGSPEEAYETAARALQLTDKYQVPGIILADQFLNDSLYTTEEKLTVPESVQRFSVDSHSLEDENSYRRYACTGSGISPRVLPCSGKALVMASGNEHREDGHLTEGARDRAAMVNKRARKLTGMISEMRAPVRRHGESQMILAGWGSTAGTISEAVDMLRAAGVDAGCVHFCDMWPFPSQAAFEALSQAERIVVVEQNSTGQFAQLLRQETGLSAWKTVLKYDGRPFYPDEIVDGVINS